MRKRRLLIVCLGNICRSPAAETILRDLAEEAGLQLEIDSCAIGDWHVGKEADPRMLRAALRRGWEITGRARTFIVKDFDRFDLLLAADQSIKQFLESQARNEQDQSKIQLLTDFSDEVAGQDVPDPYHGETEDFEKSLDMIEKAAEGVVDHFKSTQKQT